ncbi:hypothetical protein SAMN04244553_2105 [Nocardia amikacinitolerans]|uniref:Uncharacterized protein n=1 Tax=Nocardia amikacinitolerans TaxID=756689 RepID=A0A285L6M8_9NOCA|nr:SCO2521 family protein [Nocardia amikacinitolerans]SNY80534.1 hypothetical protein SAMN04244553_2105 [Nocardia amikacinitolerans]
MTNGTGGRTVPADALILLGEIHTCLVPDSGTLNATEVEGLLAALMPGSLVSTRARPIPLAISPTTVCGVDCRLATVSGATVHAIGTVATEAVVYGGRVLQSCARTTVRRAEQTQRQPWSHYLSRVGVTEVVTKTKPGTPEDLADGFLAVPEIADTLDLCSISERTLAAVRVHPLLDQQQPLLAGSTRLRWVARYAGTDAEPEVRMRLEDGALRTVRVTVRDPADLPLAQRFCADLAVHDWLLTAAGTAIEETNRHPAGSAESARILSAILEHLAHLWMPGVHSPPGLRELWKQLHAEPGFDRQWRMSVGQLRDRLAVATLAALRDAKVAAAPW